MIDIIDLAKWIVIALTPAVLAIWLYYTKVWEPNRQKQSSDNAIHARKALDSAQEFGEIAQGDSLKAVLSIQAQLITHLIESNNGHMSKLTEAVIQGDKEHTAQLEKMTAAYNQALVTLSRAAAFPAVVRMADRPDVDELLAARVKTEAVEETDAMAKAAAATVAGPVTPNAPGESTIEVTGKTI